MSDAHALADVESGIYDKYYAFRRSDRVLDLGAHKGYFVNRVKRCLGEGFLIAVEPHPKNFEQLLMNTEWSDGVLCSNVAAGNAYQGADLWENPFNTGGHSLFRNDQHTNPIPVMMVDIGDWLNRIGFKPDFIKIDTEGMEADILKSLTRHGIKSNMALEIHSDALYQECRSILEWDFVFIAGDNPVGVHHCYPK